LLLRAVRQDFLLSLAKMAERGELRKEVDVEHLATILLGNYWSTFMMINKGLEVISRMRVSLTVNLLAVLIASSQGAARDEMETTLEEIRREVQSNA
jgi:hypothetical protein